MKKYTFINKNAKVSFLIGHSKYIFWHSISEYWTLYQCIIAAIDKIGISEYSEENNHATRILVDDEAIGKSEELIYVSPHFSLEENCKVGTKSLLYRYCAKEIADNSLSDEYLQINSMLQLFSALLSNEKVLFESNEINAKSLIKLFSISFIKDELRINSNDLSYEDTILLQLHLIQRFISYEKQYIVAVDIPVLTQRIKDAVEAMKCCTIFVICSTSNVKQFENNLYINQCDFENDEDLYERMIHMSNYYIYDEYKNALKAEFLNSVCK